VNGELAKVPEFIFALVLMLGVVITVHEFGHFLVAKLCGVRVLKFSIGFGPAIGFGRFRLAWKRSGTDYVIAWFPLGGFVKMLGESLVEPEGGGSESEAAELDADPSEYLNAKPAWQKLAILFAGPGMNLLLPVVIFAASLAVGIDRQGAVVGTVERGSPAEAAGVLAGDRVRAVGGEPVRWWSEVEDAIRDAGGERLRLELQRDDETLVRDLAVTQRAGLDVFRANSEVGWAGLQHARQKAVLGVPDAGSAAARAGLRSGDRVVAVDEAPVADWTELSHAYRAARGEARFRVERGAVDAAETLEIAVPPEADLAALGVIPAVVLVSKVEEDSAAGDAGIQPGDLIVAVDGTPVGSFFTFQETVLASQGRPLEVQVARDGEVRLVRLAPRLMKTDVGAGEEDLYRIGIQGENAILPGVVEIDREVNPLVAVPRAAAMTLDLTGLFLRGLKKLLVGEISRKNVGGPIEIARQSHSALQAGWDVFLRLLVLISINVGILNLLPIPILDGGQALVVAVEGIKRSPLSLRTREIVQQVGLVVLLLLMGMAFWNDFSRNWSSFVEWIKEL
jgi:regulator of sigma E protease